MCGYLLGQSLSVGLDRRQQRLALGLGLGVSGGLHVQLCGHLLLLGCRLSCQLLQLGDGLVFLGCQLLHLLLHILQLRLGLLAVFFGDLEVVLQIVDLRVCFLEHSGQLLGAKPLLHRLGLRLRDLLRHVLQQIQGSQQVRDLLEPEQVVAVALVLCERVGTGLLHLVGDPLGIDLVVLLHLCRDPLAELHVVDGPGLVGVHLVERVR